MKRLGLLALLGAVSACGTAPIVVPAQFDDRGIARRAGFDSGCPLQLMSVSDTRAEPALLGSIGRRAVHAEDFAAWLRGGMDRRLAAGRRVEGALLSLDVQVLKAYVQHVAMSKSADIVVRVRFLADGQVRGEKVYRGAATALDWTTSENEIRGAFAMALADVVNQVATDSPSYCAAPAPPAADAAL